MDTNKFVNRHVGISAEDIPAMLETIGVKSLDELIDQTIPANIRLKEPLNLPEAMTEREFAEHIALSAGKRVSAHFRAAHGFVDKIDRLVGQKSVGNIAVGKFRRGFDRLVGQADFMERFVIFFQSF